MLVLLFVEVGVIAAVFDPDLDSLGSRLALQATLAATLVGVAFVAAGLGGRRAEAATALGLRRPSGKFIRHTVLAYLDRDAERIPFWAMVARPVDQLRQRADDIVRRVDHRAVCAQAMEALPGAGSAPGVTLPSYGVAVRGDHGTWLRAHHRPVIARVRDGATMLDLRAVDPVDDDVIVEALLTALAGAAALRDR